MSETAVTIEPTARVTGDYLADCAELAREALSRVGFTHFEETPYADVQDLCDDVRAHGASLCVVRALLTGSELPERLRFDVVGVCMSATEPHVSVHYMRGAWQS